ncbi:protein C10 [Pycnococcus provasolii]
MAFLKDSSRSRRHVLLSACAYFVLTLFSLLMWNTAQLARADFVFPGAPKGAANAACNVNFARSCAFQNAAFLAHITADRVALANTTEAAEAFAMEWSGLSAKKGESSFELDVGFNARLCGKDDADACSSSATEGGYDPMSLVENQASTRRNATSAAAAEAAQQAGELTSVDRWFSTYATRDEPLIKMAAHYKQEKSFDKWVKRRLELAMAAAKRRGQGRGIWTRLPYAACGEIPVTGKNVQSEVGVCNTGTNIYGQPVFKENYVAFAMIYVLYMPPADVPSSFRFPPTATATSAPTTTFATNGDGGMYALSGFLANSDDPIMPCDSSFSAPCALHNVRVLLGRIQLAMRACTSDDCMMTIMQDIMFKDTYAIGKGEVANYFYVFVANVDGFFLAHGANLGLPGRNPTGPWESAYPPILAGALKNGGYGAASNYSWPLAGCQSANAGDCPSILKVSQTFLVDEEYTGFGPFFVGVGYNHQRMPFPAFDTYNTLIKCKPEYALPCGYAISRGLVSHIISAMYIFPVEEVLRDINSLIGSNDEYFVNGTNFYPFVLLVDGSFIGHGAKKALTDPEFVNIVNVADSIGLSKEQLQGTILLRDFVKAATLGGSFALYNWTHATKGVSRKISYIEGVFDLPIPSMGFERATVLVGVGYNVDYYTPMTQSLVARVESGESQERIVASCSLLRNDECSRTRVISMVGYVQAEMIAVTASGHGGEDGLENSNRFYDRTVRAINQGNAERVLDPALFNKVGLTDEGVRVSMVSVDGMMVASGALAKDGNGTWGTRYGGDRLSSVYGEEMPHIDFAIFWQIMLQSANTNGGWVSDESAIRVTDGGSTALTDISARLVYVSGKVCGFNIAYTGHDCVFFISSVLDLLPVYSCPPEHVLFNDPDECYEVPEGFALVRDPTMTGPPVRPPLKIECPASTYSLVPGSGTEATYKGNCDQCDTSWTCLGGSNVQGEEASHVNGTWQVSPGFWASPSTQECDPGDAPCYLGRVQECPLPEACPGGPGIATCGEAYEGKMCTLCSEGHFIRIGRCDKCADKDQWVLTTFVTLFVFSLWFAINKYTAGTHDPADIGLQFMQISDIIGSFSLERSSAIEGWKVISAIVNFDVDIVVMWQCHLRWNAIRGFLLIMMLSWIRLVLAVTWHLFERLFLNLVMNGYLRSAPSWFQMSEEDIPSRVDAIIMEFTNFYIITYNALCAKCFAVFVGRKDLDGKQFLVAYPELTMYESTDHLILLFMGSAGCLVYVIGIPAYVLYILYYGRTRDVLADDQFLRRYGFLYRRYEPYWYYWEIVILLRRFTMTAVLVFFSHNGLIQAALGILVMALFLAAQFFARPFRDQNVDVLDSTACCVNILYIIAGMVREHGSPSGEGLLIADVFDTTTLLCIAAVVLYAWMLLMNDFVDQGCERASRIRLERRIVKMVVNENRPDIGKSMLEANEFAVKILAFAPLLFRVIDENHNMIITANEFIQKASAFRRGKRSAFTEEQAIALVDVMDEASNQTVNIKEFLAHVVRELIARNADMGSGTGVRQRMAILGLEQDVITKMVEEMIDMAETGVLAEEVKFDNLDTKLLGEIVRLAQRTDSERQCAQLGRMAANMAASDVVPELPQTLDAHGMLAWLREGVSRQDIIRLLRLESFMQDHISDTATISDFRHTSKAVVFRRFAKAFPCVVEYMSNAEKCSTGDVLALRRFMQFVLETYEKYGKFRTPVSVTVSPMDISAVAEWLLEHANTDARDDFGHVISALSNVRQKKVSNYNIVLLGQWLYDGLAKRLNLKTFAVQKDVEQTQWESFIAKVVPSWVARDGLIEEEPLPLDVIVEDEKIDREDLTVQVMVAKMLRPQAYLMPLARSLGRTASRRLSSDSNYTSYVDAAKTPRERTMPGSVRGVSAFKSTPFRHNNAKIELKKIASTSNPGNGSV